MKTRQELSKRNSWISLTSSNMKWPFVALHHAGKNWNTAAASMGGTQLPGSTQDQIPSLKYIFHISHIYYTHSPNTKGRPEVQDKLRETFRVSAGFKNICSTNHVLWKPNLSLLPAPIELTKIPAHLFPWVNQESLWQEDCFQCLPGY